MLQTDRLQGVSGDLAVKAPCRLVALVPIAHEGLILVDGVQTVQGDRILDAGASDATQRGIWVADPGTWSRAIDFDGNDDAVNGTLIVVTTGASAQETVWRLVAPDPVQIGTTPLYFAVGFNDFGLALGSMAFQFADNVNITGGSVVADVLQSRSPPSTANDVVRIQDIPYLGGGETAPNGILSNSRYIYEDVTIPVNANGLSAGQITILEGVTVTIPDGASWVIV